MVFDHLGKIVETNDFEPFGNRIDNPNSVLSSNRYRFSGKEEQTTGPESGLLDFGARMYNPTLGRWMAIDPLAEKYVSLSPYVYCANSPIMIIDPDGRKLYPAKGVSKKFMAQFKEAVAYMNSKGTGGLLKAINDHQGTIYINESRNHPQNAIGFSPNESTIYWNPEMGVLSNEGVFMSAATVLNHEADHALRSLLDPQGLARDTKYDANNPYDTKEEERVITGSEQETALRHGEIKEGQTTRKDHGGTLYKMDGPTSSTPQATIIIRPEPTDLGPYKPKGTKKADDHWHEWRYKNNF